MRLIPLCLLVCSCGPAFTETDPAASDDASPAAAPLEQRQDAGPDPLDASPDRTVPRLGVAVHDAGDGADASSPDARPDAAPEASSSSGGSGSSSGSVSGCNATTCPYGCCDGDGICRPGTAMTSCGTAGRACNTCLLPDECIGQDCIPAGASSSGGVFWPTD